ncbi:MAG TPA: hypothetical protein VG711_03925, partial [Phycisphaerales bacterium]|nr:hypothetical protein [Phycisphaerales bacterium]
TKGPAQTAVRLGAVVAAPKVEEPKVEATSPETMKDEKSDEKDGEGKSKEPKEEKGPGWTVAPAGYELRLRMSGLLWPEAADRLAHAAAVAREGVGNGQVIVFADSPTFRAAALGTTRIFENAVVCGPGMGANAPITPAR